MWFRIMIIIGENIFKYKSEKKNNKTIFTPPVFTKKIT